MANNVMVSISDEQFQIFIQNALETLPQEHIRSLENVALVYEQNPTPEQRTKLELRHDQTLFGLYEGVPLSQRQGITRVLPDKITIFKGPICAYATSAQEAKEQVRHTLWHETAHYYGLDHEQIHSLEA